MAVNIHPQYLIDAQGEAKSVLLSVEEFNSLLDELEDYEDAVLARKLQLEHKPEDYVDWEVVKTELRAAGKIK